jgi:L-alanine-DL-glutamate epimerase-like enolase superfamily enzyme
MAKTPQTPIQEIDVAAYTIPTDQPESDGTLCWDSTTLITVRAKAADISGFGYTLAQAASGHLIRAMLADVVNGCDAMSVTASHDAMVHAVRNLGRPGVSSTAIAAVDIALWDLKARLLDVPLVTLLGAARDSIPIYGSGGFTSYTVERLQEQLGEWVGSGIRAVKMKIGRDVDADQKRVHAAREAIRPTAQLFVDANGAYDRKIALRQADRFASDDVSWFEEPVSSDDLEGLRLLRDRAPSSMEIAAGEYGFETRYDRRMLEAGVVDELQADATRCAGITGFLEAGVLCSAWGVPLSAHTAPSVHAHVCCAVPRVRHLEYFHDHVRIEQMLFDGVLAPVDGALRPDRTRPGLGIELKTADAARFAV